MNMTFPGTLLLAVICASLTFASALAGPQEDVDAITKSIITEATYVATISAKKDEFARELKSKIDFSGVSDADFDAFTDLFVEESARSMVVGLRKAFQKRLLEMPAADIAMMRSCIGGRKCTADDYSDEGLEIIKDLPRFGKVEGERIGRAVGVAISPELIEVIRANADNKFENPESVLQALNSGLK